MIDIFTLEKNTNYNLEIKYLMTYMILLSNKNKFISDEHTFSSKIQTLMKIYNLDKLNNNEIKSILKILLKDYIILIAYLYPSC